MHFSSEGHSDQYILSVRRMSALPLVPAFLIVAFGLLGTADGRLSRFSREQYCAINNNHTLCIYQDKVSHRCGNVLKRGLSSEERKLVTRLHNERRSFIAMGKEKRGDPGPQPPAANMMELTYDEELEFEAQTWTDQCVKNHECPECRTLPRFKVGQNLFWYGHFVGSWERSVAGWYDEVADFNSSFVYPFYVISGVLVGHYTQMTWAQTTKIGCGKLIADQPNNTMGQEFYVCNYGLAGNLIKSEMYQVGKPCSACPPGTTCSKKFEGLCQGVPFEPLTVRPPLREHVDFPKQGSKAYATKTKKQEIYYLPDILIAAPPTPSEPDECVYTCKTNGGCSVRLDTFKFASGSVMGSCFPPSFGGSCSGTPEKCYECLRVCDGYAGKQLAFQLDPLGHPGEPKITDVSASGTRDQSDRGTCSYHCQASGCSVRINTKGFVTGSVMGSCFARDFGGKCSGTPNGCQDCLGVCERDGDNSNLINLPVGHS